MEHSGNLWDPMVIDRSLTIKNVDIHGNCLMIYGNQTWLAGKQPSRSDDWVLHPADGRRLPSGKLT